jgi:hypothetical protein
MPIVSTTTLPISLPIHDGLRAGSRLSSLAAARRHSAFAHTVFLVGTGASAALATAFMDFDLRIPGHAILRVIFPMALGLAVAPRRMAGLVMGAAAGGTAAYLHAGGFASFGKGALTSLLLAGPLLDLALWTANRGWRLYLGFAAAGVACNLIAFAVRGGAKLHGLDSATGRPFTLWWPEASATYVLCGLIAGLLSAAVWFQFGSRGSHRAAEEAA